MNNILTRIQKISTNEGISIFAMERVIGASKGVLSRAIANGTDIQSKWLHNIIDNYPDYSALWLLTGEGPMMRAEKEYKEIPDCTHIIDNPSYSMHKSFDNKNIIRYYPSVSGSMGGLSFLDNPDEKFQELLIPGFHGCKVAINAFGDSMHPLIKSGQVILLQEWAENFIEWGKIYLVITRSGHRTVKFLMPCADSSTHLTCKSADESMHPPFNIEKEDVTKLFLVKGWICRDAI
ncbi:MAG: S24 family peptidase [Phocaeicola sp.]